MKEKIRVLKADIVADAQAIANTYAVLLRYPEDLVSDEQMIVVAYYLHNLYSAFESIFQRVASVFENQIGDKTGWHAELLHRMTLDIEGIRLPLVSPEAFDGLDELRRFRHVFRSAYRVQLDRERLALVRKKAMGLEPIYRKDLARFQEFLSRLAEEPQAD